MSDLISNDEPGLFPAPVVPLQFCSAAMGGYGEWADLSKRQGVLSLIVPAEMISGQSIDSLNSREYRERFAALLLSDGTDSSATEREFRGRHQMSLEDRLQDARKHAARATALAAPTTSSAKSFELAITAVCDVLQGLIDRVAAVLAVVDERDSEER